MQNFENMRSRICSWSVLPTISPRALSASRKSDAGSSLASFASIFIEADFSASFARSRAEAWRALTRMSSALAVICFVSIKLIIALRKFSIPCDFSHDISTGLKSLNFSLNNAIFASGKSHLFMIAIVLSGESVAMTSSGIYLIYLMSSISNVSFPKNGNM